MLGNLPRSRPSVRSPRRDRARDAARTKAQRAGSAEQDPASGAATSAEGGSSGDTNGPLSRERELEELAKAGISLAGGAATLGLKAAGRAAAALRGAVERR